VKWGQKKKMEKRAEMQKIGKETREGNLSGVRSMYFIIFTAIFDILWI
jgi:hypothetical protein